MAFPDRDGNEFWEAGPGLCCGSGSRHPAQCVAQVACGLPSHVRFLRELGFFGMWKDRDDIGTGLEYVNRIRKYRREPEGK